VAINFHELMGNGGEDAGRRKFEDVVVLVAHQGHGAIGVLARPGDWGIDAFVGELDSTVSVWQAKFFLDEIGDSQQEQIRDSFAAALKAAKENGYKVEAWTLAVPTEFAPKAHGWWQKWKKGREKATGVKIELWSRTELESLLLARDNLHIAQHFFPISVPAKGGGADAEVLDLPDGKGYEEALFVLQLEAADIVENESAKQQFFNFETVAREVADKAIEVEERTIRALQAETRALWETRFNAAQMDGEGKDPELHPAVMRDIRDTYALAPRSVPRLGLVHRFGSIHQVVEEGQAGWVKHFRQIARDHGG
jgi:hypothetical protein